MTDRLRAPMPWTGGKGHRAAEIWERFGKCGFYAEPFAGSLAVLLASPYGPARREVVCDTDGLICNLWRAIRWGPEETADAADWPCIHQDLEARRRMVATWRAEHRQRLVEDHEFFDPVVAGYFAWCASLTIGPSAFATGGGMPVTTGGRDASGVDPRRSAFRGMPGFPHSNCGGVDPRKHAFRGVPRLIDACTASGVDPRRRAFAGMPKVVDHCGGTPGVDPRKPGFAGIPQLRDAAGGRAVDPRREGAGRHHLLEWFGRLSKRMAQVTVLNRGWSSALTPTVMMRTPAHPHHGLVRAVLLDPPYPMRAGGGAAGSFYEADDEGAVEAADASYAWAVEHGGEFRIAYCCQTGDYDLPEGWTCSAAGYGGGSRSASEEGREDLIYYSPACLPVARQAGLFD